MRILLVEDSPTDVLLTREAIDDTRFQVTNVERLDGAIRLIASEPFDVVLLDLGLPDSQGLDTFRKLKQFDGTIPVVILSAKDDEELALQAVTAGAQDYLVKSQIRDGVLERAIRYAVERRRTQESLRQSESRLAEAVRLARLGYWARDLVTGRLEWSDMLYELFGVDPTTFDGRFESFLALIHPEDRALVSNVVARAMASCGSFDHSYRIFVRGEVRIIHEIGHVSADREGRPVRVAGTAQDVTDSVRAEEAMRLRDRAIGAASQGIVICERTGDDYPIVYVSPGFERMTGYGAAEVLGRNCRFLQGKDTDPQAVGRVREALRQGSPITIELLNYKKDSTPFWNELSISPVSNESGPATHFVGVQTDVTGRRRLEEQLRQSQKMEAVGQLAGGIAHDFNNLLTVINGYSDLLMQSLPPGDPSRDILAEIQAAGERSAGLTRQLLTFSRRQVVAPRQVDLNSVVADAERLLRRVIGEDICLRVDLALGLGRVHADPGQLEQVLMNLAVNARDAMPTGGRLKIETHNVDLDREFALSHPGIRPGPHVLVSVSDSGSGMTDEVKSRIFEPFFTTKNPGQGTGLGLATVFGIVEASRGVIEVDSAVGVGTTFRIYLPRVENAAHTPTRERRSAPVKGTETVMLVEDEDGVRSLARHILTGFGYTVLEAVNGGDALRLANEVRDPIHLLITDVVMPGPGGRSVAEQIRRQYPAIKVLFVSGYTDDAVVRHGVLTEQVNFLQKPFSPQSLGSKVREVLDRP